MSDFDVNALNAKLEEENLTWRARENPITQMSAADQQMLLGFTPGPDDMSEQDVVAAIEAAPAITADMALAEGGIAAPTAYDLRNVNGNDYTTAVRNQLACGSCVAFGTVAVMETTYQWKNRRPNSGIDLSEAHMFFCHGADDGRNCNNGWWPNKAFDYAKDKGVATEDKFPYVSGQQSCNVAAGWQNSKATLTGYTKMGSRAEMKDWLSKKGSLTGCFAVYSDFFGYSTGVYRKSADAEFRGGHCVEIIGYDDSIAAWICKNSWGTAWGDSGYFKIGYGQCQIESWSGPYGANDVVYRRWVVNTKVNGLYSNEADTTAYAHLSAEGWRYLGNDQTAQHLLLAELVSARAGGRNVRALVDGSTIETVYVS